jgi:hypothetical protein
MPAETENDRQHHDDEAELKRPRKRPNLDDAVPEKTALNHQ